MGPEIATGEHGGAEAACIDPPLLTSPGICADRREVHSSSLCDELYTNIGMRVRHV